MTLRIVHRPARVTQPLEAPAPIVLAPPPPIGEGSTPFPLQSLLPILGSAIGIQLGTAFVSHAVFMIWGALIIFFLIVEPHGMARLWSTGKEKLRLWPFPH